MPFDANKLYCSEVLAILLQDNDGETPSRYWYSVRIGTRLVSDHDSKLSCLWHPLALPRALCAAFVLCQAVLILFADVSVLDGCKIWQLASFFFFLYFFPLLENRELLGELDGIDVLLQQLSVSNSYASCLPWRYMACFKWEVELEIVWRNKPCDARPLEYVGRFEVALEVMWFASRPPSFALCDQIPLCIWYELSWSSEICEPKRGVLPASVYVLGPRRPNYWQLPHSQHYSLPSFQSAPKMESIHLGSW